MVCIGNLASHVHATKCIPLSGGDLYTPPFQPWSFPKKINSRCRPFKNVLPVVGPCTGAGQRSHFSSAQSPASAAPAAKAALQPASPPAPPRSYSRWRRYRSSSSSDFWQYRGWSCLHSFCTLEEAGTRGAAGWSSSSNARRRH